MSKNLSTGNANVDKIGKMKFSGNIIPQMWYSTITRTTNGKPYLNAIVILADIVYWYRPTEIRDEQSGNVIAHRKKFKNDMLQRTYQQIADMFGLGKREVISAMDCLEKIGAIKRDFRTLNINGLVVNNVMFVDIVPDVIEKLTFGSTSNEGTPIPSKSDRGYESKGEGTPQGVIDPTPKGDTNTNTTQETTQENLPESENRSFYKEKSNKKENVELESKIIQVIDHLNEKAGTRYRYNSTNTVKCLKSLLTGKNPYTVEDCITVIDKKCSEWIGTNFEQYLRPDTLFGNKFEGYLNSKVKPNSNNNQKQLNNNQESTGNVFVDILLERGAIDKGDFNL